MKKQNSTTALSLPTVHPKPTKAEVINALLARAKVKHDAENVRRAALKDQLTEKLKSLALKTFKSKAYNADPRIEFRDYRDSSPKTVELSFDVQSDEITRIMIQRKALGPIMWEENMMKQNIRDGLEDSVRVRLLEDPTMVKAMDAMLEQWGL